jgi:alpha-amylase
LLAWKQANPAKELDDSPFWIVGEVYNYSAGTGQPYDYGNTTVNYLTTAMSRIVL